MQYVATWERSESMRRAKFIAEFFTGKQGKLLDVGAYKGELKQFLPKDIDYYPIDINKIELPNAKQVDLNEGHIPFGAHSFDYVVCCDVLEHLFCPNKIMNEIDRVLRPTGFAVISLPNELSIILKFSHLFRRSFEDIDDQYYKHHWHFDLSNARKFLKKFFLIVEERPYFGIKLRFIRPMLRIFPSLCSGMFFKVVKKPKSVVSHQS